MKKSKSEQCYTFSCNFSCEVNMRSTLPLLNSTANMQISQNITMTTVNQEHVTRLDRMEVHDSDSLQLYSAQTPNGIKVAVCLEELCDLRSHKEHFNYEAVSRTYVKFVEFQLYM